MKKTIAFAIVASLIFSVASGLFAFTASADGAVAIPDKCVYVDAAATDGAYEFTFLGTLYSGQTGVNVFKKVSEAAEAVPAGGEIWLAPGNYSEGVTFKKNVTIKGPKAGIDPNLRGATADEDWTLNPERGTGEAVLTTSWHMGVNAGSNAVYDCDEITVDGLSVSGAGMFRSNYGGAGRITLTIKNVYVYGYTTKNNGPFYSMSYYPTSFSNEYRRYLTLENVRVEGLKDATLIHTTCDTYTIKGVYIDANSTSKLLQTLTFAGSGTTDPAEVTISDCRFCQKASPVINLDMTENAGGKAFNAQLGKRSKVTVTIENNVFSANYAGKSSEEIAVAKVGGENVELVVRNNTYLPREADDKLPAEEKNIFGASEIRFFGRTYEKSGATWFNWCASGFEFSFKGSGASARILSNAPGGDNNAFIKIYVDGDEGRSVELTSQLADVQLASGLDPAKEHTVRVVKRTNSRSSTAGLAGLWIADGEKLPAPAAPKRLIEFIGDSLTVGYASIADVVGNTAWATRGEDCTMTYAKTIADAFGADYDVIAVSGRGIVKNYGGTTELLIPELYGTLDGYNNPGVAYDYARQPDVIVINAGTNDGSAQVPAEEFQKGFTAFLRQVREKNPDAFIIVGYGLTSQTFNKNMQNAVQELNDAGDENVTFVRFASLRAKDMALGHPLASGYAASAEQLIEAIGAKLGWNGPAEEETTAEEITTAAAEPEATTAPQTDDVTTAEPAKKGCGSLACGGAIATVVAAGAILARKKLKTED